MEKLGLRLGTCPHCPSQSPRCGTGAHPTTAALASLCAQTWSPRVLPAGPRPVPQGQTQPYTGTVYPCLWDGEARPSPKRRSEPDRESGLCKTDTLLTRQIRMVLNVPPRKALYAQRYFLPWRLPAWVGEYKQLTCPANEKRWAISDQSIKMIIIQKSQLPRNVSSIIQIEKCVTQNFSVITSAWSKHVHQKVWKIHMGIYIIKLNYFQIFKLGKITY